LVISEAECTKFVFGRCCAPDLADGAYIAPPDLLASLRGLLLKGRGGKGERKERRGKEKEWRDGRYPPFANSRIRP